MIRTGAIYQLAIDRPPNDLKLRNIEWGVLFAVDGERSVGEILQAFNLSVERGQEIFEELLDRGLIRECAMSWQEYLAAQTFSDGSEKGQPRTLAEFLFGTGLPGASSRETSAPPSEPQNEPQNEEQPASETASSQEIKPPRESEDTSAFWKHSPPISPRQSAVTAPPPRESTAAEPSLRKSPFASPTAHLPPPPPLRQPKVPVPLSAPAPQKVRSAITAPKSVLSQGKPASSPVKPPRDLRRPEDVASKLRRRPLTIRIPDPFTQHRPATDSPSESTPHMVDDETPVYLPNPTIGEPAPDSSTASPTNTAVAAPPRLNLQKTIDFLMRRAPDLNAGQLDVYRVFIRINNKLLRRNGIHSLRSTNHVIDDPELQEAVASSVVRTLGVRLPDEVFE